MKVSELIGALEALKTKHGDVPVGIADADTHWTLHIQTVEFNKHFGCISVEGDYCAQIEPTNQPTGNES